MPMPRTATRKATVTKTSAASARGTMSSRPISSDSNVARIAAQAAANAARAAPSRGWRNATSV